MSTYDNQLPQIPLEVLERVARITDNITAALNTSGVLSACVDLQRLTTQSLAASFEAYQRLSAAMQPLLDYIDKLGPLCDIDAACGAAPDIDDSVLDEASAAIEEALPYMEPEAQEYCVTEALPKLAPEARKALAWRDACLLIQTLAAIVGAAAPFLKDDQPAQTPPASPAAIIQQAEASDDRLQGADDSILVFDDDPQTSDDVSEVPDPEAQVQDVERHD